MDFLGQGILNADGELWKIQRKTASLEFNTKSLRCYVMDNVRLDITTRLIPVLNQASKSDEILYLQDIWERFAFDNICKLAFSVDPCSIIMEPQILNSCVRLKMLPPFIWNIKRFLNIGSERNLKKSIKIVHKFADNIKNKRLETRDEAQDEDLLSKFIRNDDNSAQAQFLRDIVISFILAGRDTTSSALSWFFWLLSLNSNVERKILMELESTRGRNNKRIDDTYTFDELRDMQYLHAAISECLRLYPPVPTDTKACLNNDTLPDGTFVSKGWLSSYHAYAMGRMEVIWGKNCKEYLPERWLDENGNFKQQSAFRFPIVHAGPRICMGKDMAYMQLK